MYNQYIKNNIPTLEFFDSYGFFPDDEKILINNVLLEILIKDTIK